MVINMQVNVGNMRAELVSLNKFLNAYEEECQNLYNELNFTTSYWQDPHALKFFDSLKLEELKVDTMQSELTSLKDVYSYFVEKYEVIGEKVFFVLENKENCLAKIDDYIAKLKSVISSFSSIDASVSSKVNSWLNKEKQKLENDVKALAQYRVDLKETFGKIEEIEKTIQLKLSKIDLEVVKETSVREFLGEI